MIFSDENIKRDPVSYELFGYDICADSMSYSPLGDEKLIHMEEYLLNWYVVTEEGYYIFSRVGKKVKEYKALEEMELKEEQRFL